MKILGIGESIIDQVLIIDSLKNRRVLKSETHVGGPVLSALIVLSRLNIDCTMITSLGRDNEAKIIKKTLKHEGINLLHKLQKKSKVNTILVPVDTGQRKKIRGRTMHPDIKNLDRKFIRQFDLIIIDRHEKTAFYEILKKKKPNAKIIIDPSTEVSQFTLDMMIYSDYPILPIESLTKIGAKDLLTSLKKLHHTVKKELIITAGSLGSVLYDGDALLHIPAFNISVVDTLGAGDVFRGAFAYGITQGWDAMKCATFGNFVGGLQCTKLGNVAAIPTRAEMEIFPLIYKRNEVNLAAINDFFTNSVHV